MNSIRTVRLKLYGLNCMPIWLPKICRNNSSQGLESYEFIQAAEPRPGVGQSILTNYILQALYHSNITLE